MSREKRGSDGLTARERNFALFMCKGKPVKEAYRLAGLGGRSPDENISSHAYRVAKRDHIVTFMDQWLRQARISDLDSPGAAVNRTLSAINAATEDRNWTAIAALQRLSYQHNGIAERTTVQVEMTYTDTDLLQRIANGDPDKVALLSSLLRPGTFAKQPDDQLLLEGTASDAEDLNGPDLKKAE